MYFLNLPSLQFLVVFYTYNNYAHACCACNSNVNSSNCPAGIYGLVTIKETLEACHGGELKQEYVDKVMEKITFDESEAIATSCLRESGDPLEIVPRETRSNGSDEVKTEKYEASAKWTDSAQKWKETNSGWSAKVGIGGEKYVRGDCSFEYHRGKTEKDIENKSFEISKVFEDDVVIDPHSSCEVTVIRVETEYTADIKKLRLKFPHDTKLKVHPVIGPAGKTLLSEILEEKVL